MFWATYLAQRATTANEEPLLPKNEEPHPKNHFSAETKNPYLRREDFTFRTMKVHVPFTGPRVEQETTMRVEQETITWTRMNHIPLSSDPSPS